MARKPKRKEMLAVLKELAAILQPEPPVDLDASDVKLKRDEIVNKPAPMSRKAE